MNYVRTNFANIKRSINNSNFKARRTLLFSVVFICLMAVGVQFATIEEVKSAGRTGSAPNPPGNLTVSTVSSNTLTLRWQDNSSDETGFSIYRCQGTTCTNFASLTKVGANTTSFSDTN